MLKTRGFKKPKFGYSKNFASFKLRSDRSLNLSSEIVAVVIVVVVVVIFVVSVVAVVVGVVTVVVVVVVVVVVAVAVVVVVVIKRAKQFRSGIIYTKLPFLFITLLIYMNF